MTQNQQEKILDLLDHSLLNAMNGREARDLAEARYWVIKSSPTPSAGVGDNSSSTGEGELSALRLAVATVLEDVEKLLVNNETNRASWAQTMRGLRKRLRAAVEKSLSSSWAPEHGPPSNVERPEEGNGSSSPVADAHRSAPAAGAGDSEWKYAINRDLVTEAQQMQTWLNLEGYPHAGADMVTRAIEAACWNEELEARLDFAENYIREIDEDFTIADYAARVIREFGVRP